MKHIDFIIYKANYAAGIAGVSCLLLLTLFYLLSGAINPDTLPEYFSSFEQLFGQVLLLIVTPAFLLVFVITAQRRSVRFGRHLVEVGVTTRIPETWMKKVDGRLLLAGLAAGLVYALALNIPARWLYNFSDLDPVARSIVVGQCFLWTIVGLVLSIRLQTAWAFNKQGRVVHVDIYDTSAYQPFARNGMDDVLAIAALLALTTLQALDAQFRVENYLTAILLAIPAAALLFLLPTISIHRRLADHRVDFLAELNRQVSEASREIAPESISRLELLMQHRDRIAATHTWPIDLSMSSRLAFYVIIPPLAWLAAALVEFGVVSLLTGG